MLIPTVAHEQADPPTRLINATEQLLKVLPREHPELKTSDEFKKLTPSELTDSPTLHLDDLSEIALIETTENRFYQDRARLRAFSGDLVASCSDKNDGYEEYCRDFLGLGSPDWLRPQPLSRPESIAQACWDDVEVRYQLCEKLREGELSYIHPSMGTLAVWELAELLSEETGVPLHVIAPPPRITSWVNNKVAFTETVQRLFGSQLAPTTRSAWNQAHLAKKVQELAGKSTAIGLKLPDSAGGEGNIVLQTAPLRGKSLTEIDQIVRAAVSNLDWKFDREMLVDVWETNVLSSPSCQLWIPPAESGPPIVEGIFTQTTIGEQGTFYGATSAQLPADVRREIVDDCWLLGKLYQGLGYLGRCSFDLILVGDDLQDCRIEFIECNGRWGGTSLPMTLMNRIFGDFKSRPFAIRIFQPIQGLDRLSFAELLTEFEHDLFDIRTGNGSLIFFNPGRIRYCSGVSAIVLGISWEDAAGRACQDFMNRLDATARNFSTTPSPGSSPR